MNCQDRDSGRECGYPIVTECRCANCAVPLCPLHAHKAQMRYGFCTECAREHEADLLAREWTEAEEARLVNQSEPRY